MVASDSKKPRLDPHHPLGESEFKSLYGKLISEYNQKCRAGVVQWQYRSFPSFGRGFDSHRPLHNSQQMTRLTLRRQVAKSSLKMDRFGGQLEGTPFNWREGWERRNRPVGKLGIPTDLLL